VKSLFWLMLAVLGFPQLHRQAFLYPVRIDDAGAAEGRPAGGQQISLWLVVSSLASTRCRSCPGRVLGRLPERGDIVIVTPQNSREDYIKRVIGLPGDTIEVRGGELILNGVPVPQKTLPPLMLPVDANAPCPPDQFPGALAVGDDGKRYCRLPVREETLPNGRRYQTIDVGPSSLDWYGPVKIPANHLFLMGDNRDNSADSRATLAERGLGGPVPFETIGGRAEFITFSVDGTTSLNPLSWWSSLRGGRAGSSLHAERE
jgi:signal peptidase I